MDIICDLEANGLKPTKIWVICCKDVETGNVVTFHPTEDSSLQQFIAFSNTVGKWIGHNFLGYDIHALRNVLGVDIPIDRVVDTLVLSKLFDSRLNGHSLEDWGGRFGVPKLHTGISDWSVYRPEMEERCVSDVEVNYLLFKKLEGLANSPLWQSAITTESYLNFLCYELNKNGFSFDLPKAELLKSTLGRELKDIISKLKEVFLPKVSLVREVIPRATKFGTIAKNSIPKVLGPDLSPYTVGHPFSLIEYVPFNPGSSKQRIERLNEAGWKPVNKTKGHKDAEKALRALKRGKGHRATRDQEIAALEARLAEYRVYGWATDEDNLATLPPEAPVEAQSLVRYLLLSSRLSTLETWLAAYDPATGRVHGSFNFIEPWTQRMSHVRPNMGNIPKYDAKQPAKTPYSDELRRLWKAYDGRYLVGVDAESIQLRILAHYINDPTFTKALIEGKKEDGTDPHSLNQRALGSVCKSRDDAKTFIYAWILDAGIGKVAQILGCTRDEAKRANDNFLDFYPGLKQVKEEIVPYDAARGYFQGIDGRYVYIHGEDFDARRHYAMAGYLQNGEKIIMARAVQIWYPRLKNEGVPFWWVNFVHDEWQTETIRDMEVAQYVGQVQAEAIRQVGIDLGLNCPMAGSVLNSHGRLAVGDNWMETH